MPYPQSKRNKIESIANWKSLPYELTCIFIIFINTLQYIVMFSSRKFNSPFNVGQIVVLRLFLQSQHLVEPPYLSAIWNFFCKNRVIYIESKLYSYCPSHSIKGLTMCVCLFVCMFRIISWTVGWIHLFYLLTMDINMIHMGKSIFDRKLH